MPGDILMTLKQWRWLGSDGGTSISHLHRCITMVPRPPDTTGHWPASLPLLHAAPAATSGLQYCVCCDIDVDCISIHDTDNILEVWSERASNYRCAKYCAYRCQNWRTLVKTICSWQPPTLIAPGVVRRAAVQVNVAEARHRHPEPRLVVLAVQGLVLAEPVLKYF